MKVLALTFAPTSYWSAKYRVYAFGEALRRMGVIFEYDALPYAEYEGGYLQIQRYGALAGILYYLGPLKLKRLYRMLRSSLYDVVLLQRSLLPGDYSGLEELLAELDLPLVYDFDDALFTLPMHLRPGNWDRDPGIVKELNKVRRLVEISRGVIAGNRYLAGYARQYNPNVVVVPTPVDTTRLAPRYLARDSDRFVIGWLGTWSNLHYLSTLKPVFRTLSRRYEIVVKLICERTIDLGVRVLRQDWSEDTEAEDISSFDVAVMPLQDDEWTRGKCGFKLLKYMSVGVPSVASPVGMNAEIIRDGRNGFLAAGEQEWVEKLSRLLEDRQLRERFSREGRSTVVENYSLEALVPKFHEMLRRVADAGLRRPDVRRNR